MSSVSTDDAPIEGEEEVSEAFTVELVARICLEQQESEDLERPSCENEHSIEGEVESQGDETPPPLLNDELVIQYLKSRGLGNLAEQVTKQTFQAGHYAPNTPETAVSEKQSKDDAAFKKSNRVASFKSEKEELGVLRESGDADVEQGRVR